MEIKITATYKAGDYYKYDLDIYSQKLDVMGHIVNCDSIDISNGTLYAYKNDSVIFLIDLYNAKVTFRIAGKDSY